MSVALGAICELVKGGLDPQRHASTTFAHYSIPAFDSGRGPAIESGAQIHSQKTPIPRGVVLVSKLNPRIPRVWHIDDDQPHPRVCSTEFVPLRPDPQQLTPEYLGFALREALQAGFIKGNTAAATKSRERAKPNDFLRLKIKLPPLPEQRRIVDLLSRAASIVRMRREAEARAKEIAPALFLDMFGDPTRNERGWAERRLGDVAEVVSGVAKGRKLGGKTTRSVAYLRVANVQAGHLDLSQLKMIEATPAEIAELAVRAGDVLLTEGGDHDKLGRGALLEKDIGECIHQNHVFRVRADPAALIPEYFASYLQADLARNYFLRSAKRTTNLASINMTQLRNLPVVLPPLPTQKIFARRLAECRSIEKSQAACVVAAGQAFQSLLAGLFQE